jgi:hypothetical protein
MAGGPLRFDQSGNSDASVVNLGRVSIRDAGLATFVAPHVRNDGVIVANFGRVTLGSANAFTLDLYGDNLVSFALTDAISQTLTKPDGTPLKALVENNGRIAANGGQVVLTAQAAREVVNQSVNVGGIIEANTVSSVEGRIILSGSGNVTTEASASLSASGERGGTISISGDDIHVGGSVKAEGISKLGSAGRALSAQRDNRVMLAGADEVEDGDRSSSVGHGGTITIDGGRYTSLDGTISANGRQGGTIAATSQRNLALNGAVSAKGSSGDGGRVDIQATGETWEASGASIDVSGANGGVIRNLTGGKLVSSANYYAQGSKGLGGKIDVTAWKMFLLSSSYDASGSAGGGRIRIGGEYQGGKNLVSDELNNAHELVANDGVSINVSATGNSGNGGTAVLWSDNKTTFLGHVYASGGLLSGTGGLVEASSANELIWRGTVDTARGGQRGGTLLLDPKNITIADATFDQMALILGAFYPDQPLTGTTLESNDNFGIAVSLDGLRLAVGAHLDDGAGNLCSDCGSVYLFNFTDNAFSGGTLAARIGSGYSGPKDINLSGVLGTDDHFGVSVSLDGTHLAVGALWDDGLTNSCGNCGAAYIFSYLDNAFFGGTLTGRVGDGYSGPKDINLAGSLDGGDHFGVFVSLDGTRLAVGANLDDGATNSCGDCGAAYLFTYADITFSGGMLAGRIGRGYSGAKDIDLIGTLGSGDNFGISVSLDGTRLAAGAYGVDACGNACGAAYFFNFADSAFSGGALTGRIGAGYTGPKDINLAGILGSDDSFGFSVSLDGNRLAVEALFDDGATNSCSDCGAIYLFTFTDSAFSGGVLTARIGDGYTGPNDVNLAGTLEGGDLFGHSVSLDGMRLAAGAVLDDGANNTCSECGAVYLFTFTDLAFAGGALAARIGDGYGGGNNFDLAGTLGSDSFGVSVSLDGTRLAVGAYDDDGATNSCDNCGAAYLFTFTDLAFAGGALAARIGDGYTGGNNINLAGTLGSPDQFGISVSLDGTRLAVGAYGDDGATNSCDNCGAVYLFTFTDLAFAGGALAARIGDGYGGGINSI